MANALITRKGGGSAPTLQLSSNFVYYGGADNTFKFSFTIPAKSNLYKHFKFELGGSTSVINWHFLTGYSGSIVSNKEYELLDTPIQIEVGVGKNHIPKFNLYLYK